MIVKFAYFNGSLSEGLNVGDLKAPLQGKDSSFISIKDVLNVGNDFRFCEMSIWGMKINPSQKISCDSVLKKVEQVVAKVPGVNKLSNFG